MYPIGAQFLISNLLSKENENSSKFLQLFLNTSIKDPYDIYSYKLRAFLLHFLINLSKSLDLLDETDNISKTENSQFEKFVDLPIIQNVIQYCLNFYFLIEKQVQPKGHVGYKDIKTHKKNLEQEKLEDPLNKMSIEEKELFEKEREKLDEWLYLFVSLWFEKDLGSSQLENLMKILAASENFDKQQNSEDDIIDDSMINFVNKKTGKLPHQVKLF